MALAQIGPPAAIAVSTLQKCLKDKDTLVRVSAAYCALDD